MLAGCSAQPIAMPQTPAIASARTAVHHASSSYEQLFRFHPPKDGSHPEAGLLNVNGTLYGTTANGGLSKKGTVFSISTSGVEKALYRFRGGSDGANPWASLLDVNGTLYGTTDDGGGAGCSTSGGCGTVFSLSTSGAEKVLYAFQGGSDGAHPLAGLIDVNGTLYGTTSQGGGSGCSGVDNYGCGTVFSVTTSGKETVVHRFAAGSDGWYPSLGDLIDVKGVLYGTTPDGGGSSDGGIVYSITPAGVEKVLYAFQTASDGNSPEGSLIDVNGVLYGTTNAGGNSSACSGGCGVVFAISTKGAEKVVYRFAGGSDGAFPEAGLIDVNGVLYGTTTNGGGGIGCFDADHCGTVFSVTTAGAETVLYGFAGGHDGDWPTAPLTNVNGTLYGTTLQGGDRDTCCHVYGYGSVFSVSP
jgi:uncharacterized repeat protein (TIGR03803 family)